MGITSGLIPKKKFKKPKEPLIKEYFDLDKHIERYLYGRLPFKANSKMKISLIHKSNDNFTRNYRAIWINSQDGGIELSLWIKIVSDASGKIIEFSQN